MLHSDTSFSDYPPSAAPSTASSEAALRPSIGTTYPLERGDNMQRHLTMLGGTVSSLRDQLESERRAHIGTRARLEEETTRRINAEKEVCLLRLEVQKMVLASTEILSATSAFARQVDDELDLRNRDTKAAMDERDRVLSKQKQASPPVPRAEAAGMCSDQFVAACF